MDELEEIRVYPNPSSGGLITIDVPEVFVNSSVSGLNIINLTGKVVYKAVMVEDQHIINVSNLNKGVYLMRFQNGDSFESMKLVVE